MSGGCVCLGKRSKEICMAFKMWIIGVPGEFGEFYAVGSALYESKEVAESLLESQRKYDSRKVYARMEVRPVEVKYLDKV